MTFKGIRELGGLWESMPGWRRFNQECVKGEPCKKMHESCLEVMELYQTFDEKVGFYEGLCDNVLEDHKNECKEREAGTLNWQTWIEKMQAHALALTTAFVITSAAFF